MKHKIFAFLALLLTLTAACAGAQQHPSVGCFSPGLMRVSEKMKENPTVSADVTLTVENAFYARNLSVLKKMPEDYYDMILMDIQMPEMDGYEATKLIRNLDDARADIPIVAMTANAFEEDRQKALESGMNAHVSKPVDMNMLFKVMAQILKK